MRQAAPYKGLRCWCPLLIAHTPEAALRDAIMEVDGPGVDAIVQSGVHH